MSKTVKRVTVALAAWVAFTAGAYGIAQASASHGYPDCPQSLAAGVRKITLAHDVRTSVWLTAHPGQNLANVISDTLACSAGGWQQKAQYTWVKLLPSDPVMHRGMWLITDRTPGR